MCYIIHQNALHMQYALYNFHWQKRLRAENKFPALSLSINPKFYFCGVHAAFFVFPLTGAAEKHIVSENTLIKRVFKDTGVVLAGIECSQKSLIFASGIPVGERGEFFDTLRAENKFPAPFCYFTESSSAFLIYGV